MTTREQLEDDVSRAFTRTRELMTNEPDNLVALEMFKADEKRARNRLKAWAPDKRAPEYRLAVWVEQNGVKA